MTQVFARQCVDVARAVVDPYVFFREYLGLSDESWTIDQRKIIDAVVTHKRVAVSSGNGTGKTYLGAALILWFLFCHRDSRVISTASTFAQVEQAMWPLVRKMHANARRKLGGKVLTTKITPDELRHPDWFAVGISTNDPTSFQGRHAPYVFILLDEATGIDGSIFEAAELMAYGPDDRLLAMGNPTDASSRFFQEVEIPDKWFKLEISGENHPNFLQRKTVIPGAISYERIVELEKEYGREHPVFQARVLGRWSRQLGRMFPQFERPVGRHTYDPKELKLPEWLAWWAACDWGYAHNSAVLWARFDGKTTYVARELVKPGLDSRQLARSIAEATNAPNIPRSQRVKLDAFCLSHDAFNRTDGPRSRADEIGDELRGAGLPWPTQANRKREDGLNIIRTMLNNDTLKISIDCPKLIAGLKRALVDPDKPEDMLKEDGDDEVDSLRYLLTTNPRHAPTPLQVKIEEKTRPMKDRGDYLTAMIARMRLEDEARVERKPFSLGRFFRR